MHKKTEDDEYYLNIALEEAKLAASEDEVPVGAVLIKDHKILAKTHNRREQNKDPAAHAEILALQEAAQTIGHWNLSGAKLYVTLEPCPMCAGAMVQARISELIYSTPDPKGGAISLGINILENKKLNHRVIIKQGPENTGSKLLLQAFFQQKRKNKKSGRITS